MADTNITKEHQPAVEPLTSGAFDSFALFSCYLNGEAASAIVSIQPPGVDGEDEYLVHPLFVSITSDMILTDHHGHKT